MKRFKLLATQCLLVVSMLAPWGGIGAGEAFEDSAVINKRSTLNFVADDRLFRLSSQMKMFSDDSSRRSYSDLRPGDIVYIRGEIVNGQYYVREIHYETPDEH